jgi:glycosyltransferase involved in cell wall biosynthesis
LRKEHPIYTHFGDPIDKRMAREQLNLPKDAKILLFFGFIREYKGLMNLIESMKFLPEDVHLVIAGEMYGSFDEYDAKIQSLKLAHRVHKHVRYIPDSETPLFFCSADACILPYKTATQSGIIAIAHHFEVPVIATPVGGLPEALRNGKAGMIVKGADIREIANGINEFFDKDLSSRYIERVRALKKELSWTELARDIIAFYEMIKSSKSKH